MRTLASPDETTVPFNEEDRFSVIFFPGLQSDNTVCGSNPEKLMKVLFCVLMLTKIIS